jgi:hypothetical protein
MFSIEQAFLDTGTVSARPGSMCAERLHLWGNWHIQPKDINTKDIWHVRSRTRSVCGSRSCECGSRACINHPVYA